MAHLNRTVKSASDWTIYDLWAYNIDLVHQGLRPGDVENFFGVEELPDPQVDTELLTNVDADAMKNDRNAEFVHLLDEAHIGSPGESAVDDFLVELFKRIGYVGRDRVARTRKELRLLVRTVHKFSTTDVCIMDYGQQRNDVLLLVQKEMRFEEKEPLPDPRGRLVANAIAAFMTGNAYRANVGFPTLESKIIPGIVMAGTSPIFFKIPITSELVRHVKHGTYPPTPTIVTYCYPPVPSLPRRRSDGMKPLESRREILQCFEAFKNVAGF